ncbi:alpha/beta fold hydrolase [Herpetosiphon gulosus]|uniref:Alpha/beta hydrolase fold-5 domain-containing protein n=1 Tax=Herpetosiphon gulosus TaxID=1973496 RepID=A0ABP9X2U1_9CHLR
MKLIKRLALGLVLLLIIGIAGFVLWASNPAAAMPTASEALVSDQTVTVSEADWLIFEPSTTPTTGLIFYPGARVAPAAYAPLAHELAKAGYLVVIVPMPLNMAIFGSNRADAVLAAYPQIAHWALGGHSLGGAMAAKYTYDHPDTIDGLILLAAYPTASNSLAERELASSMIYASNDGLATLADIEAARPLMPSTTRWVEIQGGNHAQFGWYGEQSGDLPATISHAEQQQQTVQAALDVLQQLDQ